MIKISIFIFLFLVYMGGVKHKDYISVSSPKEGVYNIQINTNGMFGAAKEGYKNVRNRIDSPELLNLKMNKEDLLKEINKMDINKKNEKNEMKILEEEIRSLKEFKKYDDPELNEYRNQEIKKVKELYKKILDSSLDFKEKNN